jgi:DNA-binding beta-propeller fold protein YncE
MDRGRIAQEKIKDPMDTTKKPESKLPENKSTVIPGNRNVDIVPVMGILLLFGGIISFVLSSVDQPVVRGILIGLGVVTLFIQRISMVNAYWGGILIVLGILALIFQRRGLLIAIGAVLILASVLNFLGGKLAGWTFLGIPQILLGALLVSMFPKGAYGETTEPSSAVNQAIPPEKNESEYPNSGYRKPQTVLKPHEINDQREKETIQPVKLARVFISYSRKDIAFARILNDAIHDKGLESWIDWQDIPPSAEWLAEVYMAIEASDTFVFVVSKTSIGSDICNKELEHALKNNKRLIPIVIEDMESNVIPKAVADLNWIFVRKGTDDFQKSFEILLETIKTNLEWVKSHTRLQVRALEWMNHKEDESYLLRGQDLHEANLQLARANAGWNPQPTEIQRKFLLASIAMREREIIEREASHRRELKAQVRIRNIAVGFALVLGFLFLMMWNGYNPWAIFQVWLTQSGIAVGGNAQGVWAVYSLAFSPDGKLLASGSADTKARIWDVATGKMIGKPLVGHTNYVRAVKFSPDGKLLASASSDETIRLWDVSTGQLHGLPLKGHTSSVEAVAFSPDGKTMASSGTDGRVQLWDVPTGQQLGSPLVENSGLIFSVAFSPDGHWLVWGNSAGALTIWNLPARQSFIQPVEACPMWDIAFSPDGKRFALACDDGTIMFFNTLGQSAGLPIKVHTKAVWRLAFSPDGRLLASGSADKSVVIVDAATGQPLGEPLSGFFDDVPGLAFSPDGKSLATGSFDDSIRLWDVATRQQIGNALIEPRSDGKTSGYQFWQANDTVSALTKLLLPIIGVVVVFALVWLLRLKNRS